MGHPKARAHNAILTSIEESKAAITATIGSSDQSALPAEMHSVLMLRRERRSLYVAIFLHERVNATIIAPFEGFSLMNHIQNLSRLVTFNAVFT